MGASRFFGASSFLSTRGHITRCNSGLYCAEFKERQRFGGLLHHYS
jgi:hypothetical protein